MGSKVGESSPKGKKRRAQILREADLLFAEQGYLGASLHQLAERIGFTQSGLLHHFKSKEQLLFAVLEEHFTQDSERAGFEGTNRQSSVLESLRPLAEHNTANPMWTRFFCIMAAESLTVGHPAAEYMRNRYAMVRADWAAEVALQMRQGRIRPDIDPVALATLLIAVSDGLQVQWLHDDSVDLLAGIELLGRVLDPWLVEGAAGVGAAAQ
ncbi:TetR/AcrR family transcriptional regulator [Microterricola pindariensis]|uniref:HTH tetR-type domain-containing protein n=1 Tax=Microterricola pindariensis TaxID=478010 RepID=A0ABX5B1L0_9MICO|nr:TetR/AcrR family transcriptional regulator [Microterricola pindariensis]PPL20394.1 hypothetical protein GY24_01065 [Microterricola pindariensis]